MTGAGAGRGLGNGGQWALVFAELSPSKTLQPLDKYDLIPPHKAPEQGVETGLALDPPTLFYRLENLIAGGKKTRGPEFTPFWVVEPDREWASFWVKPAVIGSQPCHSQLYPE